MKPPPPPSSCTSLGGQVVREGREVGRSRWLAWVGQLRTGGATDCVKSLCVYSSWKTTMNSVFQVIASCNQQRLKLLITNFKEGSFKFISSALLAVVQPVLSLFICFSLLSLISATLLTYEYGRNYNNPNIIDTCQTTTRQLHHITVF